MDDRIMCAICFRRRVNGAKRILEQVEYYDHNMQLQPLFNEDNFDWCKLMEVAA